MTEYRRSPLIVVVDNATAPKSPGGVELESQALSKGGGGFESVVVVPASEVRDTLAKGRAEETVVYVQAAGYLSADYHRMAGEWLATGAYVVEKNVFAKASRFRPVHDRYLMAVMSEDGRARYSVRSACGAKGVQSRVLLLGNPIVQDIPDRPRRLEAFTSDEVVFLRIGRPDPIKWNDFELEFCRRLSRSTPRPVRLIRVGYPGPARLFGDGGLTVEDVEYCADPAGFYSQADVYIHSSAIGETFGNTIAEAVRAGLPIVLGVDWAWDCAGAELVDPRRSVVGRSERLVRDASRVLDTVMRGEGAEGWSSPHPESRAVVPNLSPEDMLTLIYSATLGSRSGELMRDRLSPLKAVQRLAEAAQMGWDGRPTDFCMPLARELARAFKDRQTSE